MGSTWRAGSDDVDADVEALTARSVGDGCGSSTASTKHHSGFRARYGRSQMCEPVSSASGETRMAASAVTRYCTCRLAAGYGW